MKAYRVVMAGGGTGGHLYPGIAVAQALEKAGKLRGIEHLEMIWAATGRAVDQRLLSGFGERYVKQAVQPFPGMTAFGKWWGFWKAWRASCGYWAGEFGKRPADCVVALGGYAAGPAAYVAAKKGIPVILLNPDALPGRANRFLIKRSNIIVTQWPLEHLGSNVRPLGCPIRADLVGRSRAEGASRLGVDASRKTLIVTGASLGAKTINDALLEMLETAMARKAFEGGGKMRSTEHRQDADATGGWQIIHLSGMDQAEAVRAAYAKWPGLNVKVIDYCDDMASIWAVADLAIARAGASTCAELTACGVPSILLPYPFHKDMHQLANARELEKAGAAVIVNDAKDAKINAAAIQNVLQTLLYDETKRAGMASAARRIGKPDAADAIASEILALMQRSSR